jgi:hypothetical protein
VFGDMGNTSAAWDRLRRPRSSGVLDASHKAGASLRRD